MYDLNDSPFITSWSPYRGKFTFLARFLIFILCIYASALVASVPAAIATLIVRWSDISSVFNAALSGQVEMGVFYESLSACLDHALSHPVIVGVNLISQVITAVGLVLYVHFVERRRLTSVGLCTGRMHVSMTLLAGAGLGVLLPLLAFLLCLALRSVTIVGVWGNGWWTLFFLVGFLMQAFSEELLYRGYFLSLFLQPGRSPWVAIAATTVFHVLPQIGPGMTLFGVVNTALMGLLLAVLAIRTGSVWLTTALSALWNVMMVSVFGASGLPAVWRVFSFAGNETINGGVAGFENGAVMTLVLLVALMLSLFIPSWKKSHTTKHIFTAE